MVKLMKQIPLLLVVVLLIGVPVFAEEPGIVRIASRLDDLPPIVSIESETDHLNPVPPGFALEEVADLEDDASTASSRLEKCKSQLRHSLAGNPQCVKQNARLTYDSRYTAYYVGGATPFKRHGCLGGDKRCSDEGTFGVDYAPWYSRVNLRWSHGILFQDGTGQYEPDRKSIPLGLRFGKHAGKSSH